MNSNQNLDRGLGLWSATIVIFASMIGAGILGNSGEVLRLTGSPAISLFLWFFIGLMALAGSLIYAELAALFPRSGGEYNYLREIFGELPAFLSGWVSFLVGFAAPVAASAFLFVEYASGLIELLQPESSLAAVLKGTSGQKALAMLIVLFFTLIHIIGVRSGSLVQNGITSLKLFIILLFSIFGFAVIIERWDTTELIFQSVTPVSHRGVGVGMLLVLYAYGGWNAATYLGGEIKNPARNLPRALFVGTLVTTLIYLALNLIYFLSVPVEQLSGSHTPAMQAAQQLFGSNVALIFNLAFCLILLSGISVNTMLGPRIYFAMARNKVFFKSAASVHPTLRTPYVSILFQSGLALLYIATGSYYSIMIYMGFALTFFPLLTVIGFVKLRQSSPALVRHYRAPLYPLLPIFYIGTVVYLIVFSFINEWQSCLSALGVIALGIPVYYIWKKVSANK